MYYTELIKDTLKGESYMQENELKGIVAKNIAALRTKNKMTQLELGTALSYSDKAVSKWERAESIPDVYVLMKIAELFGCSVDYLLHSHEEDEVLPSPKNAVNHMSISLISVIGVWTLAALVFIIMYLAGFVYPLIFAYALVASTIVLTVFNAIWGSRKWGVVIISALVWSVIATVYLIFLTSGYNYWQLLLLGIPGQLIVLLCFFVKRRGKRLFSKKSV